MTKMRIKGHKLIHSRSGAQDAYADGCCECGYWFYKGWTERAASVRASHQSHLRRVQDGVP